MQGIEYWRASSQADILFKIGCPFSYESRYVDKYRINSGTNNDAHIMRQPIEENKKEEYQDENKIKEERVKTRWTEIIITTKKHFEDFCDFCDFGATSEPKSPDWHANQWGFYLQLFFECRNKNPRKNANFIFYGKLKCQTLSLHLSLHQSSIEQFWLHYSLYKLKNNFKAH